MIKLGALVVLGLAPFVFFVSLQNQPENGEPEQPPTQPISDDRIPLAFPFGTPEPSTVPTAPVDPNATTVPASPAATQCSDGRDNDLDGRVDLRDTGCTSRSDNSEAGRVAATTRAPARTTAARLTTQPVTTTAPPPPPTTTAAPPATTQVQQQSTAPPVTTTARRNQGECSDGEDNDGDGKVDLDDPASCHGDPTEDE